MRKLTPPQIATVCAALDWLRTARTDDNADEAREHLPLGASLLSVDEIDALSEAIRSGRGVDSVGHNEIVNIVSALHLFRDRISSGDLGLLPAFNGSVPLTPHEIAGLASQLQGLLQTPIKNLVRQRVADLKCGDAYRRSVRNQIALGVLAAVCIGLLLQILVLPIPVFNLSVPAVIVLGVIGVIGFISSMVGDLASRPEDELVTVWLIGRLNQMPRESFGGHSLRALNKLAGMIHLKVSLSQAEDCEFEEWSRSCASDKDVQAFVDNFASREG